MKSLAMVTVIVAMMVTVAAPAGADVGTGPVEAAVETPTTQPSLDVDLKLGLKSFRLGTRIFGKDGYAGGAWINGETRSDGFSLDGRIERDGKARNFKFNADIDEWLRRAVRWWSVTDL